MTNLTQSLGTPLRVGYVPPNSCQQVAERVRGLVGPEYFICGRCWAVLELLEHSLAVDFESVASRSWGIFDRKSSSWTGMVGMILNGTIDLTMPDLAVTSARHDAVALSYPVFLEPAFLFLACESFDKIESRVSFGEIFGPLVWLCLVVSCGLFCAQLTLVVKISENCSVGTAFVDALSQLFEHVVGHELAKPHSTSSWQRRTPARLLHIALSLLLFILIDSLFQGQLFDTLRRAPVGPFDDIGRFFNNVEAGKKTLVADRGTLAAARLAEHDLFRRHSEEIDRTEDFPKLDHNRYVLFQSRIVVLNTAMTIEAAGNIKCFASNLGIDPGVLFISFGVRKDDRRLREWLDRFLLRLHETGILAHFSTQFDPQWRQVPFPYSSRVDWTVVAPVVRLCLYFIGFSAGVLLLEIAARSAFASCFSHDCK